jgi:hypothetical protein
VNCQYILDDDEDVSQEFALLMGASVFAIVLEGDFGEAVEKGVLENNHDINERLLVSLEVRLEGKLIEEAQVDLFKIAVILEEGYELWHEGMQCWRDHRNNVNQVYYYFYDLILEVPLQKGPVQLSDGPYTSQYLLIFFRALSSLRHIVLESDEDN